MQKTANSLAVCVGLCLLSATASGKNYAIQGENELSGGIGFAADLTQFAPGGFKWFNEYGLHFRGPVWLNLQFNIATGGGGWRCGYDNRGRWTCSDKWRSFGGTGLELGGGVKLKWRVAKAPVQIHAKFGAAIDFLWFGDFYGVAIPFRGGAGVRYFVLPTLGVGGELMTSLGPAFIRYGWGAEFYGAIDLNLGVEWRF